jgi:GTPase
LAGHEAYLRTTINGLSTGYPDMALVCISDKITRMTTEHIGLAISLNIPVVVAFTKVDLVPADTTAQLIVSLKKKLTQAKRTLYHIRNIEELKKI